MFLVFNWQLFQKDEEGMGDKHAFYFNRIPFRYEMIYFICI